MGGTEFRVGKAAFEAICLILFVFFASTAHANTVTGAKQYWGHSVMDVGPYTVGYNSREAAGMGGVETWCNLPGNVGYFTSCAYGGLQSNDYSIIITNQGTLTNHVRVFQFHSCPIGTQMFSSWMDDSGVTYKPACVRWIDPPSEPQTQNSCRAFPSGGLVGNPILLASAEKYRRELDWSDSGPAPLSLVRTYRSSWGTDTSRLDAGLGQVWNHNHAISFKATPSTSPTTVEITFSEGYLRTFTKATLDSLIWTATNGADTLTQSGSGWVYRRADDDAVLVFTSEGKLQTRTERGGFIYTYSYDSTGRLAAVNNGFGRTLVFAYSGNKLVSVSTPDGRVFGYSYDSIGSLATVSYPDGKSRGFLYENPDRPRALTGIIDESGARWGTFGYDYQGRAISTELAGGVSRYQVSYPSSNSATVVDPLNTSRSYSYANKQGMLAVTSGSLPSAEGEADAASRVQDANGLITSESDFKGVRTDYVWDTARRLLTSVTEAAGTPEARTTTTQWHATMALPTLVTETGRSTAYTYDAQGRVLSKSLTDTLVSPNITKNWSWTYNAQGLVSGEQAPNSGTTSYTYDTRGNVLTATNAVGHVSSYAYDSANRLVSQIEPNGLVTIYTWDARDRLLTQTVGGTQITALTYNPTGTLASLTVPMGLSLTYTYDVAQRLTGWSNNRGESGTFTLDAMGNRVAQEIRNSAGALAYSSVRTINNINRVSGQSEGGAQSRTYGYDADGERILVTNALNQSTQWGLDNLRRTKSITNAANASASLAYNALDGVTGASDFKGVSTAYGRDAHGNATVESSADSGSRVANYDSLGLPQQIVDALGQATNITRDAIGRPTQFSYTDGKTATLTWDAAGAGKGYLRQIQDPSGITVYTRDAFGRVTSKTQSLSNGSSQSVSYSYVATGAGTGQIDLLIYPGGEQLKHSYDGTGRITGLSRNGAPIVSNITWNPLGQPTGWTWTFSSTNPKLAATRSYDTAGRMTATEFSNYTYDAAGRINGVVQNLYRPGDTKATGSSILADNVSFNTSYDAVGRLLSFNGSTGPQLTANTASYGYDANGNRTTSSRTQGVTTVGRSYTVTGASNQLTGFTQTIGSTSTAVAYGYNANGALTTDGLKRYAYDAQGRMNSVAQGSTDLSAVTRYAHNALGQRVFKTEPLYPPTGTFGEALTAFQSKGWTPATTTAEILGYAYAYSEDGTVLAEDGMGGAQSSSTTQHIYLPTQRGPMPVATILNDTIYAVQSDHLNTPRRITAANGQVLWQWAYSGFGEDEPTTAAKRFTSATTTPISGTTRATAITYNMRFPGQMGDAESGLFYNYFRSYSPTMGRYTQADPIGLDGGWNRFGYVNANPLIFKDPKGLLGYAEHSWVTGQALSGDTSFPGLEGQVSGVDFLPGSQETGNSFWHAMRDGKAGQPVGDAFQRYQKYIDDNISSCTQEGLARALHAVQDSAAAGHRGFQPWFGGVPDPAHIRGDVLPSKRSLDGAIEKSKEVIRRYKASCPC